MKYIDFIHDHFYISVIDFLEIAVDSILVLAAGLTVVFCEPWLEDVKQIVGIRPTCRAIFHPLLKSIFLHSTVIEIFSLVEEW